jgi:proteic killer suppression protein
MEIDFNDHQAVRAALLEYRAHDEEVAAALGIDVSDPDVARRFMETLTLKAAQVDPAPLDDREVAVHRLLLGNLMDAVHGTEAKVAALEAVNAGLEAKIAAQEASIAASKAKIAARWADTWLLISVSGREDQDEGAAMVLGQGTREYCEKLAVVQPAPSSDVPGVDHYMAVIPAAEWEDLDDWLDAALAAEMSKLRVVIQSFADKRTAAVWADRTPKGFPSDLAKMSRRKLRALAAATELDDLRPPGNHLEALVGDRDGQHSIRINDQWRLCFVWRDGDAYDVEIVDYHGGNR